jgi:hypothetical protein
MWRIRLSLRVKGDADCRLHVTTVQEIYYRSRPHLNFDHGCICSCEVQGQLDLIGLV